MKENSSSQASLTPDSVENNPKKTPQKDSYWDEKISEQKFYAEDIRFGNTEIDMFLVKPWRVKICTDA